MPRFKNGEFMTLVGDYTNIYLPLQREVSPNTVRSYQTAINLFDEYMRETGGANGSRSIKGVGLRACDISCLEAKNVLAFLDWLRDERGNSAKTREQRLSALVGLADYAAILDISNSATLVDISRIRIDGAKTGKVVGHMTEDAWQSVVGQPDAQAKKTEHRNWVFMILMYETAARNQEVLDLRAKDIVLSTDNPRVYIKGKGRKERLISIRGKCATILQEYLARFHSGRERSDDPLFYTMHRGEKCPLSPDTPEKFLARYGEAARKENPCVPERVHPHLIRHTRAVHLLEGGMELESLSKMLGHESVSTTKIYLQSSAEIKRVPLAKARGKSLDDLAKPGFWEGDEEIIKRLEGVALS